MVEGLVDERVCNVCRHRGVLDACVGVLCWRRFAATPNSWLCIGQLLRLVPEFSHQRANPGPRQVPHALLRRGAYQLSGGLSGRICARLRRLVLDGHIDAPAREQRDIRLVLVAPQRPDVLVRSSPRARSLYFPALVRCFPYWQRSVDHLRQLRGRLGRPGRGGCSADDLDGVLALRPLHAPRGVHAPLLEAQGGPDGVGALPSRGSGRRARGRRATHAGRTAGGRVR
mmetsp:Transcript_44390/g.134534  ORF Transcript_44390/g.134534 Transcript_44390/m.134534 type:complete len:228 (-) Transcript_44390:89-772(-)